MREFLAARHHGHSEELNRGTADGLDQVDRAANWRPAHKSSEDPAKYSSSRPISWILENANREADACTRISAALDSLKKRNRSFTTVELQKSARCSRKTLYKHQDIWRQDYDDLADGFFAGCTHEYNAVEGSLSAALFPSSVPEVEENAPAALATGNVASEISMRSKKERQKIPKEALSPSKPLEIDWLGNVTRLIKNEPQKVAIEELKSLLSVLPIYLATAPCQEGEAVVFAYLSSVRTELKQRSHSPKLLSDAVVLKFTQLKIEELSCKPPP